MKASQIKIGGTYLGKVSGNVVPVVVDAIREVSGRMGRGTRTVYDVTNTKTGRKTVFRAASKFRSEVIESKPQQETNVPIPAKKKTTVTEIATPEVFSLADVAEEPKKTETRQERTTRTRKEVAAFKERLDGIKLKDPVLDTLKEWYDAAGADRDYALIRAIEKKTGQPWFKGAEKGESLESFVVRVVALYSNVSATLRETSPVVVASVPVSVPSPAPITTTSSSVASSVPKPSVSPAAPRSPALVQPVAQETKAPRAPRNTSAGLFGFPATAVMRWMGGQGWSKDDALKALRSAGVECNESTVGIQIAAGKKGGDCGGRGPAATLNADQVAEMNRHAGKIVEPAVPTTGKKTGKKTK